MNILFFNSIAADVWGGGEKWMLVTARGLRDKGHSVYFSGRNKSIFLQTALDNDFQILPLNIKSDFGVINIFKLVRYLKKKAIQIVIPNYNKDVRLAGIAKKFIKHCFIVARNGLPILPNKLVYRLTYTQLVDGMITNSKEIKNQYLNYGWIKGDFIKVIHNGIDTSSKIRFVKREVLEKYNLPSEKQIIGIFGRLTGQKQHDVFIKVAEEILMNNNNLIFLIVGDGPLRKKIESQINNSGFKNNFYMLGMQRNVMELYSICNVVLLTSYKEGLPNVVMESMLAETPVVAFNVGGVKELIPDDNYGFVIPLNDIDFMAQKGLQLLNSEKLSRSVGQNARNRIIRDFSIERMIESVESYLSEMILKKSNRTRK